MTPGPQVKNCRMKARSTPAWMILAGGALAGARDGSHLLAEDAGKAIRGIGDTGRKIGAGPRAIAP